MRRVFAERFLELTIRFLSPVVEKTFKYVCNSCTYRMASKLTLQRYFDSITPLFLANKILAQIYVMPTKTK